MGEGQPQFLLAHSHPATPLRLDHALFSSVLVGADALVPVAAPGVVALIDRNGGDSSAYPFITYSEDSGLGRLLSQHLTTFWKITGLELLFTSHHAGMLKAMAVDGRGLAWLPRSLIPAEVDRGILCPWEIRREARLRSKSVCSDRRRGCATSRSPFGSLRVPMAIRASGRRLLRIDPPGVIHRLDRDPKL